MQERAHLFIISVCNIVTSKLSRDQGSCPEKLSQAIILLCVAHIETHVSFQPLGLQ